MRRLTHYLSSSDQGASMMLVAMSLLLLIGASAVAVDLAAMRLDRSADQKVTDSAASAGALAAFHNVGPNSPGQDACEAALAYVAINAQSIGPVDSTGCASDFVSPSCDALNPESHPVSVDPRFSITVTYPVPDNDPLMTSAQLGAPTQTVVVDDGGPCERVGVQMSAVHDSLFAQLLGFDQGTTTVHTVARSFLPPPDGPPINLLLLDRFGCGVMKASGSSNAGIIVDEIVDPATGEVFPGEGAVDSNATIGCPTDTGTIDIDGSNASIRADGPPNCGNPLEDPPGSGQGCGFLKTLAPGATGVGCNWPACTGGGHNNPNPPPTASPSRLTRAPIDHRYNCRVDGYATPDSAWSWAADALTSGNEQDIPACEGPQDPRIHNLIANVGASGPPSGTFAGPWQSWASLHPDCSVDPGQGFSISGNVWTDCPLLEIKDTVTITDGSLVLQGDLSIASGTGHLVMDNDASDLVPRFLFMRGGLFTKAGQASLTLTETTVYLSRNSRIRMAGGSTGTLTWIAPDDEDHPFDDLALWSDSTVTSAPHAWEGQAGLNMEGVFFVPIVTVEYAGQGSQLQVKAQFISDKLHARGQGELVVAPVAGRAVDLKSVPATELIR